MGRAAGRAAQRPDSLGPAVTEGRTRPHCFTGMRERQKGAPLEYKGMIHRERRETTSKSARLAQLAAWLGQFTKPGQVIEVRILNAGRAGTVSGYFDDVDRAAKAAAQW